MARPSKKITAFNETKTVSEWLTDPRCKVERALLHYRLKVCDKFGMAYEDAISYPPHHAMMLTAWGETKQMYKWVSDYRCGCHNEFIITARMGRGWTAEEAIAVPRTRGGVPSGGRCEISMEEMARREWLDIADIFEKLNEDE